DLQVDAVVDVGLELDLERDIDVAFAPTESRRHHADDLIVLAHELKPAAHDARVAREISLPERIAEHDDAFGLLARRGVRGDEPAAFQRANAPMIRSVRRDV